MAPPLRLSDWTRLYEPEPGDRPRLFWREAGMGWWYACDPREPAAALREMVERDRPGWELVYDQSAADARQIEIGAADRDTVVIADHASADHWRGLLRRAGLLPASAG
jgi:hypothetical protein